MPAEIAIELAQHPNIIAIKESSGSIEKVQKMVEGTRGVRREVAVTETFAAVTPRMLRAATANAGADGELVTLGGKPSSAAVQVVGGLKTRQKEVGFQVLVGAAHKLQPSLDAGAVGAILAFACCAPTACFEIYTAWKENNAAIAREKQQRIAEAATKVVADMSIPGVKYAMDLNGYYGGPPRLPLTPPTEAAKREIEEAFKDLKG